MTEENRETAAAEFDGAAEGHMIEARRMVDHRALVHRTKSQV